MRILYDVPVIHVSADLGAIASPMDVKSAEICGKKRWAQHKDHVLKYWDELARFCKRLDARHLCIYQDGLMAGGELGLKIIKKGASQGSRNHEIVLDLLHRGAQLRKTEDTDLLSQEYARLLETLQKGSIWEKQAALVDNESGRDPLLEKRDHFVADTISETLYEGETGILFMGAFHDVAPWLTPDITLRAVKNREKVAAYFTTLMSGGDEKTFNELAAYLAQPPAADNGIG